MDESEEYMRGWLRGFYDGEGWATFWHGIRKGRGHKLVIKDIGIGNTEFHLIDRCARYLAQFGIKPNKVDTQTRAKGGSKPFRRLHITSNAAIKRFHEAIGFSSPEKAGRVAAMIAFAENPNKYSDGRRRAPHVRP